MIVIDFSFAIALLCVIAVGLVMAVWMLAKKEKGKDLGLDPKFIWHCSVCTYTYIKAKEEVIYTCPRCGSYNKK